MDEIEANHFHEKVQERITKRKNRVAQTASTGENTVGEYKTNKSKQNSKQDKNDTSDRPNSGSSSAGWRLWKKKEKKEGKPKLSARDIGAPEANSFMHIQGVKPSFEGTGGFEMVDNTNHLHSMDPRIKDFMMIAGLDENFVPNPKKAKKIQEWAEENDIYSIMDKKKENAVKKQPPARPRVVPSRVTPSSVLPYRRLEGDPSPD